MSELNEFILMRNAFREEIKTSISTGQVDNIKKKFDEHELQTTNKRSALDQALRERLIDMLTDEGRGVEEYRQFLNVCVSICRLEMAVPVLSVVLLSDIFDSSTIEVCEQLFVYVEENVSTWKEPLFFSNCKNNILRMCNDLLRRLSRSQNTIFCGRILLFLAMFFPFSERSGLNIVSEFNLENETHYDKEPSSEVDNGVEIVHETSIKIDHNFYVKFWSLQDFFRNPNQCYSPEQWTQFMDNTNVVLRVLKNYKVEADPSETLSTRNEESHFFAKFLTSQKLLVLQMNDVHFRRTIYLQFLIIFQYLDSNVKSKPEGCELTPEQSEWVSDTTKFIYNLIKETPPDGEWFLKVVLLELERDECWSEWKNEGCPALKPASTNNCPVTGFRSRRPLGQIVKDSRISGKLIIAPGKKDERPTILNVKPELLKKCRNRVFVPDLQERFEEIAQQADPAAMIEPQYKRVNSFHYGWSSLRVLATKSPHFYAVSHKPVSKLPDYLELMSKRILRDRLIKELAAQVKTENKDSREDVEQSEAQKLNLKQVQKENDEGRETYIEHNNYDDMETKDSKGTEEEPMDEDLNEQKRYVEKKKKRRGEEHFSGDENTGGGGDEDEEEEEIEEEEEADDEDDEEEKIRHRDVEEEEEAEDVDSGDESGERRVEEESDDEQERYEKKSRRKYKKKYKHYDPHSEDESNSDNRASDREQSDGGESERSGRSNTEVNDPRDSGTDYSDNERDEQERVRGSSGTEDDNSVASVASGIVIGSDTAPVSSPDPDKPTSCSDSEDERREKRSEKGSSDVERGDDDSQPDDGDQEENSDPAVEKSSDIDSTNDYHLEEGEVKDDDSEEEPEQKRPKRKSHTRKSRVYRQYDQPGCSKDDDIQNIRERRMKDRRLTRSRKDKHESNSENEENIRGDYKEVRKEVKTKYRQLVIREGKRVKEVEDTETVELSDNDGASVGSNDISEDGNIEREELTEEMEQRILGESEDEVGTSEPKRGHKRKSDGELHSREKILKISEDSSKDDRKAPVSEVSVKKPGKKHRRDVEIEKSVEVKCTNGTQSIGGKLSNSESNERSKLLKKVTLEKIAQGIGSKWQKVAEKLGFKENEIECFSSQNDSEEERAKNMLYFWWSNEEHVTADTLRECLEPLGLLHAMDFVLAKT